MYHLHYLPLNHLVILKSELPFLLRGIRPSNSKIKDSWNMVHAPSFLHFVEMYAQWNLTKTFLSYSSRPRKLHFKYQGLILDRFFWQCLIGIYRDGWLVSWFDIPSHCIFACSQISTNHKFQAITRSLQLSRMFLPLTYKSFFLSKTHPEMANNTQFSLITV